jgi:hypothetical protein
MTKVVVVISGAIFVQNPLGFWQQKSATRDPHFFVKKIFECIIVDDINIIKRFLLSKNLDH